MEEIQEANCEYRFRADAAAVRAERRNFDYAEPGYEEYRSSAALTKWLRAHDFEVIHSLRRAGYGFLCHVPPQGRAGCRRARSRILGEYDALRGQGHGCAHHMQTTPAMIGAAMALRGSAGVFGPAL